MTRNVMLNDPAVVLTSMNPSLSEPQPKPLDVLIDSMRVQVSSLASSSTQDESTIVAPQNSSHPKPKPKPFNGQQKNNNTRNKNQQKKRLVSKTPFDSPIPEGSILNVIPKPNPQQRSQQANMQKGRNQNNQNLYFNRQRAPNARNQLMPLHNQNPQYNRARSNSYSFATSPTYFNPMNISYGQMMDESSFGNQRKLGSSNEFVSREIYDYYCRNRQTNNEFQLKQFLRSGLELTLQEGFPDYSINLYLVGSSTNGIGDSPKAADICILARKNEPKPVSTSPISNGARTKPTSPVLSISGGSPVNIVSSSNNLAVDLTVYEDCKSFVSEATTVSPEKPNEEVIEKTSEDATEESVAESVADTKNDEVSEVLATAPELSQINDISDNLESKEVDETIIENVAEKSISSETTEDKGATSSDEEVSELKSDLTLNDIHKYLESKSYIEKLTLIPAKVPVLKFTDTISQLNVTLNLNQEVSIRNTQLIRDYSKLDWRFAPLAMIFKRWAQENRICNGVDQTISSYNWSLMTIHFLQVCEPPVLPSLQKMNPRRYEQHRGEIFKAVKFWRRSPPRPWQSQNTLNLRQLMKSLFRYYGYVFNFQQNVISVREGRVLDRNLFGRRSIVDGKEEFWIPNHWTSFLAIEEPFTKTNTSCSVHDKEKFERIVDLFRLSSGSLRGIRISLFNILADDLMFPITY